MSNRSGLQIIQSGNEYGNRRPLFLIHDASGTIQSYYTLGNLQRPVYGLANPNLESGAAWDGGIDEMARTYAGMIKREVPSGRILLGGWSLGGLLAFHVAWIFACEMRTHVGGIVMIDSPFPHRASTIENFSATPFVKGVSLMVRQRILITLKQSLEMLDVWTPPTWIDCEPPPTIMLRASDLVDLGSKDLKSVARVDVFRNDKTLGWGQIEPPFSMESRNIPGHHFSVFAAENIYGLTREVQRACTILDV